MALTATMYRFDMTLSDVDRSVYEALEVRVARHPSESMRYFLLRTLAYGLCYEEGLSFSKGGISATDEAPLSVRDATGSLRHWIDIGSPSADRLHKATKAAPKVTLFTAADLKLLRREAATREVHRLAEVVVQRFEPAFLEQLEPHIERNLAFELVRNSGVVYLTLAGRTFEAPLPDETLLSED